MLFFLALTLILSSSCRGSEYFAVNLQILSTNQTWFRHGQNFQPCDTLEYWSRELSNHSSINITIYLLDSIFRISKNSYFFFTATKVEIKPWNNDSLATIDCVGNNIYIHCYNISFFSIQWVQFLQCGEPDHPVIIMSSSNKPLKLVLMQNSRLTQRRGASLQILSNIIEMKIINCIFTKCAAKVILLDLDIISNAIIRNSSFINNTATSLYIKTSSVESN